MKAEIISKEQISEFKQTPIKTKEIDHAPLRSKLDHGLILGNTFKGKCQLIFNTTSGEKIVRTTIWNVTNEHVELKGGTLLNISSIINVEPI